MILVFLLTLLVVVIPTLHVMNTRYVQQIALFLGAAQMAYLAFAGKLDSEVSSFLVSGFNHVVSFSYNVFIKEILLSLAR